MSVLVVGISHRSAAINVLERVALDADAATKLALAVKQTPARRRGRSTCHLQPHRGLRRPSTGSTAGHGRGHRDPVRASPAYRCWIWPSTSTCTTRTVRSRTCSRLRPGWTRWSSARVRSSARCRRRCASARSWDRRHRPERPAPAGLAGRQAGPGPRPASTRAGRSVVSAGLDRRSAASTVAARWSSAPARWPRWPRRRC